MFADDIRLATTVWLWRAAVSGSGSLSSAVGAVGSYKV